MSREYSKTLTGNPDLIQSGFDSPPSDPFVLLRSWFEQADALNVVEARAMTLSTVNGEHKPSSRVVLITSIENGIYFGTRDDSRKGIDIQNNPYCAGNLFWRETISQINFQGKVSRLSDEASNHEFSKRIPEAQAVTVCCQPSIPMKNELLLKNEIKALLLKNQKINRPSQWHLYCITLDNIEFWVGSNDRFHKRLRYELVDNVWQHQILQP